MATQLRRNCPHWRHQKTDVLIGDIIHLIPLKDRKIRTVELKTRTGPLLRRRMVWQPLSYCNLAKDVCSVFNSFHHMKYLSLLKSTELLPIGLYKYILLVYMKRGKGEFRQLKFQNQTNAMKKIRGRRLVSFSVGSSFMLQYETFKFLDILIDSSNPLKEFRHSLDEIVELGDPERED
ncbi:hypothetical protein TNIN_431431 [Trichonephila inaurata madagascariensis]|uniref:Uncharacterized protein n=1 Tax=Trichonephila inaurata madagascariensis TaxID=2747483 RepID=A0A8X6YC91_9ARAC|nr:hypothetical protein TNIN_431431 [Trichonephila inaurata madagascariensis]